jgi:Flp pilus assembly protein TadG
MLKRFFHGRGQRANVTVEFALLATFFLLPLTAGSADLVVAISAQGQLNTALQALYYFGLANPTSAISSTDTQDIITAINSGSVYNLSMPATLTSGSANPSFTYVCYTTGATSPTFSTPSTTNTCTGSQTAQTFANYKVSVSVSLPFPIPLKITNPLVLTASGSVQTQ